MEWQERFKKEFVQKPGEHLLNLGITGSGKTQDLYWLLEAIITDAPKETILWNDAGKSDELLVVGQFGPLHILLPEGMDLDIESPSVTYTKDWFTDPADVWRLIQRGTINVLCIEPFIRKPQYFTPVVTSIFSKLIDMAHDHHLPVPLSIFYDEFHRVAPGKGQAYDSRHAAFGAEIQYNIETLRSLQVRFIASTHGWTKLRKGVRSSFNWFMINRGGSFTPSEQPKLARFNQKYEKLQVDECIIAFPNKVFTDIMQIPYYGEGWHYGKIHYHGKITPQNSPFIKHKKEVDKSDLQAIKDMLLKDLYHGAGSPQAAGCDEE